MTSSPICRSSSKSRPNSTSDALRHFLGNRAAADEPGLAATTLLVLILNWNEYLFAVFLAIAKVQTMPIMVQAKNAGEKGVLWWEMCAIIVS